MAPPAVLTAVANVVMLIAGCAGNEPYRAGKVSITQGNYDQAVEELRQAAAREPSNMDYRLSLAEAQSLAADQHVAQAEKLLGENKASAARRELQIALDQMPAHPRAILLIKTVEKQVARCDEVVAQARSALSGKDWAGARRLADQALAIDPSHPEAEQVRGQAAAGAVAEHAARAKDALDKQDWAQCTAACAQIRAADPSNETAANLERQAADRQEALRLLESAAPLEAKGDHLAAVGPLGRAATLWPENETVRTRLAQATQSAISAITARADEQIAAGHFAAAVSLIDQAIARHPQLAGLTERRQRAIQGWTNALLDAGEQRAMAGAAYMAWPSAVLAVAVAGNDAPRAAQFCEQTERMVRQQLARKLGVAPLKSATAGEGSAAAVARILTDELGRLVPEHIAVTGPSGNATSVREHEIALDRVAAPDVLPGLAEALGRPDLVLFVEVVTEEHTDQQAQRYPVYQDQRRLTVRVRLRLVEVAGARVVWSDDETTATAADNQRRLGADRRPAEAGQRGAKSIGALRAEAIAQLPPLLQAAGQRLLVHQAAANVESAKRETGDRAVALVVRCLFELPAGADRATIEAALQRVFSDDVAGTYSQRCRQIATQRLRLDRPLPPASPATTALAAAGPDHGVPGAAGSWPRRPTYSEATATAPASPPGQRATAAPVIRQRSQVQPEEPVKPRAPGPSEAEQRRGAEAAPPPVSVYRGTISRDDDRFPKELKTLDGIVVKVDDTDADPLDADLEVRVSNRHTRYKDQRVGARIRGRGVSGRYYLITILAIADDTETVHFSLEPEGQR